MVEAQGENKDVEVVENGQIVEIKVETLPFTLYGTIAGKVLRVSHDTAPISKLLRVWRSQSRSNGPAPHDRISLESLVPIYQVKHY